PPVWNINTNYFGWNLFYYIGGSPGLVWFQDPNFKNSNSFSKREHWHKDTDSTHADAVDLTSWSGHNNYNYQSVPGWHFFRNNKSCIGLVLSDTGLGNTDADWAIFDTCASLYTHDPNDCNSLKNDLLSNVPGGRCAHMFLGFVNTASWSWDDWTDHGEYFAKRLNKVGIKQAWFDYCKYRQPSTTYVRVFYAEDCKDESLAGPGPIEVRRDPTKDSPWTYEDYPPPP
ncbi:MAG: hypothetical protein GWN94_28085, partial [Phycisphaerae bacterium]|nr:hypothetical protein [Phycisphaerae bacterium]NIS54907.1 hypothetical protein [Phycisphaerae bacterium]NIX02745.1 hypothetical protein [Phycisphaerae bacterium]